MTRKILAGITALVFVLSSAAAPGGVAASLLSGPQITASAVSYGDFEYTVSESGAEITAYNGTDAKVQIPETVDGAKVVSIGNYAFNNCTSLESITIPEGVTKIGYGAFNSCKNLSEVVLPDSLTALDNYAFEYCTALTDITLPAGLTTANDAFCNSGLTSATFKDGMTKIPSGIFSDCSEFKSITFPASVTELDKYAFSNCTSLESITIPEGVTKIGYGAFNGCKNLSEVVLPDSLTALDNYAFEYCTALTDITLPAGLTTAYNAFYNSGLTSATFKDGMTKIPNDIFYNCSTLKNVTLPDSVTEIGSSAFRGCSSLEYASISNGITKIGDNAFALCSSLKEFTVPASVTEIDGYAFSECTSLEKLFIHKNVRSIGSQAVDPQSETTIYGDAYSVAAEYASANDIPFVATSYDADSANSTYIDLAKSSYASNSSSFSITGYCTFTTEYALRSGVSLPGGAVLTYQIPASAEIDLSTVEIDGKYISNAKYNNSKHLLTVPISKRNGKVAFRVKLIERRNYISTCRFMPSAYSGSDAQIIGTVCMNMDMLTLNCPEKTSLKTLNISGITAAEQEAEIYVDGALVKTVRASKGGTYKTDITLPDAENYRTYTVTVKTTSEDGSVKRAEKAVTYQDNVCEVTDLTLEYKGKTYSSSEIGSLKPIIVYKPGDKLKLKVKLSNNENVHAVNVINKQNGMEFSAKAEWDEKEQVYIAEDSFGISGVPLSFGVEIEQNYPEYDENEMNSEIKAFLKRCEGKIDASLENEETIDGYDVYTIGLKSSDSETYKTAIVGCKTEDITNGVDLSNYEKFGLTKLNDDMLFGADSETIGGKQYTVYKTYYLSENYISSSFSNVTNKNYDKEFSFLNDQPDFGNFYDAIIKYKTIILSEDIDKEIKAKLIENIDCAFDQKISTLLLMTTVNYDTSVMMSSVVYPDSSDLKRETRKFINDIIRSSEEQLKTGFKEATSFISNDLFPEIERKLRITINYMGDILDEIKNAIDPSGIVYDADSKKPIYGATVTIYYKEDLSDKNAALWDAAEYDQQNPITTDEDGFYAWDVPAGYWQVKAECDGYETSYSDWLPVPPPQLEVNIPLKKINVPHVHTRSGWIIDKQPKVGVKGSKHIECTECGEILETAEIPALGAADITSAKVTLAGSSLEFTGKTQKPSPTVTLNGKKLKNGTDYTVSYKNNKAIGKAYVIVKGKNNYTGTIKKSFNIVPQKQVIVKLSAQAKAFSIKWTLNKNVTGYQIKYSTASNFSGGKSVYVKKNTSAKKTLTSLKSKKAYYVKVRSYKTVNGVKYYGAWSNAKKIRTK